MTLDVIPGPSAARSPESITPTGSIVYQQCVIDSTVVMDSGLAPTARPGMTAAREWRFK